MRLYFSLCAFCYALFLLLPLPFLGSTADKPTSSTSATTVTTTAPTTVATTPTATTTAVQTESQAVFKVLNTATETVHTFSEREFLIYTVAAEMPASYPIEALKAQAVATYTYYTYKRSLATGESHFSDVPTSFPDSYSVAALKERWGQDYDTHIKKITDAVDAVSGQLVRYEGEAIYAAYHSCNGGRTESAKVMWDVDYPYLQSVASSGDTLSSAVNSTVTVTDAEFAAAFPSLSLTGNADTWISGKPTVSAAGTVTAITIGGETLTGREVRSALELRSPCFTVTHGKDGFTFTVRGYGHGVGLSQHGARTMAEQGCSYTEILRHYYTGTTVS